MIKTAATTEKIIIYGNKYRTTNPRIDEGLKLSEQLFYKGNYQKALTNAMNVLEIVDKDIKNKVVDIYEKI